MNWELVRTWDDPNHDKLHVHVAIDGEVIRRASLGDAQHARRIVTAVRDGVEAATLDRRYGLRPRPRLGAGTVGYARRRRA